MLLKHPYFTSPVNCHVLSKFWISAWHFYLLRWMGSWEFFNVSLLWCLLEYIVGLKSCFLVNILNQSVAFSFLLFVSICSYYFYNIKSFTFVIENRLIR
jgi:hypothetical protein